MKVWGPPSLLLSQTPWFRTLERGLVNTDYTLPLDSSTLSTVWKSLKYVVTFNLTPWVIWQTMLKLKEGKKREKKERKFSSCIYYVLFTWVVSNCQGSFASVNPFTTLELAPIRPHQLLHCVCREAILISVPGLFVSLQWDGFSVTGGPSGLFLILCVWKVH